MPGKTQYQTDAVLNVLRGTNITAPVASYAGLLSVAPSDDSQAGTELTGAGGYARQAVTWRAPATDTGNIRKVTNSGVLTFGPATGADWAKAVAFGVFDALTNGNMLYWDYLLGPRTTVTADASTDTFTATGHGLVNSNRVQIQNTGGALPAGLSAGVVYFVIGATANTFQLSATSGGAAIDITTNGTGLNVVALDYSKTVELGDSLAFNADQLIVKED